MKYMVAMTTLLISSFFVGAAAASDVRLVADPSVPAAVGKADLHKDKNGNLRLKLKVYHLAKPSSLTPAKQAYVVWIEGRGKTPENQGQLKVNNKLEGKFENTTNYEAFDIYITAEDNPGVQTPSEPKLLKGTLQP
ncbi:MAG: hypothetical protein ABJA69_12170 [Acidobacteriaceae bacterium]